MDSTIDIFNNTYLISCKKELLELDKIINKSTNNKNMILYRNKNKIVRDKICENINLLKLMNLNFCLHCDKYADYIGLCIDHYNQNNIDDYIKEYYEYIDKNKNNIKYITDYLNEYKKALVKYKKICMKIIDCFNKFIPIFEKEYVINNEEFNYDNINIVFNDDISYKIIERYYYDHIKQINNIILVKFLHRKYKFDLYQLAILFKKNTPTKIFIGNNNILYNHIFNSNIITNVEYIDTEYPISINGHTLRFDIFMVIKVLDIDVEDSKDIKFHYLKLVIETDEQHHNCKQSIEYDTLKDKYCIENKISLLRINILNNRKISNENINFCLFFIKYLLNVKKPIYYFSKKYIKTHNTNNDDVTNDKISIDNTNIDNFITFGSNKKNIIKKKNVNDFKNLRDIKNIDDYIKTNLSILLENFANETPLN
jgi:hypothetical protein